MTEGRCCDSGEGVMVVYAMGMERCCDVMRCVCVCVVLVETEPNTNPRLPPKDGWPNKGIPTPCVHVRLLDDSSHRNVVVTM